MRIWAIDAPTPAIVARTTTIHATARYRRPRSVVTGGPHLLDRPQREPEHQADDSGGQQRQRQAVAELGDDLLPRVEGLRSRRPAVGAGPDDDEAEHDARDAH